MTILKRFFLTLAAGGLLGAVAFAWFSPGLIEWYFSPPADLALTCKPAVQWAIETYRQVIFAGVIVGAIVSAILFLLFAQRGSKKAGVPPEAGTQKKEDL